MINLLTSKRNSKFSLSHYADPMAFHEALNVEAIDPMILTGYLQSMLQIRAVERKLAL